MRGSAPRSAAVLRFTALSGGRPCALDAVVVGVKLCQRWLVSVALLSCGAAPQAVGPCLERGTSVIVDLGERALHLCLEGRDRGRFEVAIGRGGAGKRVEGDERTPVGTYRLGSPRASRGGFHRFIPIGYPTSAQRRAGYTGGAVGIHGPARGTAWLGDTSTWVDWTQGCVALGSDLAVEAVEAFVRAHRVSRVHLF